MTPPRETKRRYHSPRRDAQAAATRREILEAAGRLFERDGYAATTMAAVAEEAAVSLKTVYVAFEAKAGVLRALWNLRLRGDETETPVGERAWYRELLTEPDPERQLRQNARNSRAGKERFGGVLEVIRSAASSDAEIESLWSRIQSEYRENQRSVAASVAEKRALRRGLDVERAADVLWTLNNPDVWQLLVGLRGWSPDEYERWSADTAVAQLLG
ncbi:MAG TPA: TetR/AcrR family transcriptional regulator [Gaiellaceae bacterium]|nr:TetR/AcrR family transcriptional regulator [Gaiellaceae bacterium]